MMADIEINSKIQDVVDMIIENYSSVIGFSTNENSQLQGMVHSKDILEFLLNNYNGDIDIFKRKFRKYENSNDISHFTENQYLVRV